MRHINCEILEHMKFKMLERFFPDGSDSKESAWNAADLGSIPRSERSPGKGTAYPVQYSCLKNSMDRGVWLATESDTTEQLTTLWNERKIPQAIKKIK